MACQVHKYDLQVQCSHKMLDVIQLLKIFKDSKTFVDLNLTENREKVSEDFDTLMEITGCKPSLEVIQQFLQEHFESVGEIEDWTPEDFKENPKFLEGIIDEEVKEFACKLVKIWPKLGRKVKQDVFDHPEKYTLVSVPNGFIVPGGRFKEIYYWDCYWIVKGLLLSEMVETTKGILENCFHLVRSFGFVPNGNRVYYLNRSQPPMLTMTVVEYMNVVQDFDWLRRHIDVLERELNYWIVEKSVTIEKNGQKYDMFRYITKNDTPRPESYNEDIETGNMFEQDSDKKQLYSEISASAESGWDFSSRWIFDSDCNSLSKTQTSRVIPVDLNAFLCRSFLEIARFFDKLEVKEKSEKWKNKSLALQDAIHNVFYDENDGIWYDFDLKLGVNRKLFFTSNFTPLWTQSFDKNKTKDYGKRAVNYLKSQGILEYFGGIPSSLVETGQQWDFPNCWAPLQDIIIMGLENSGHPEAHNVAQELAQRWVKANMKGYEETKSMFEKYDVRYPGKYGGGGEYDVQSGFGWTNGVALQFINYFYKK